MTPNSISNLIPQQVRETTPYNLRQNDNYYIPTYRLQSTILSFIPSTLNLWNSLDLSLRNRPSLNQFKYHLKRTYHSYKVPPYFLVGDRKFNILLTRLRNCCSSLNADLFHVNLTNSQNCICGHEIEDSYHYFFECPMYQNYRIILMNKLRKFGNLEAEDIIYGSESLELSSNKEIQILLQNFIKATNRF